MSPRSTRARSARALAVAPPTLAALVGLCLTHCGVVTSAVTDARSAQAGLGEDDPDLLVVDTAVAGGSELLANSDGVSTIALVDLERGASSFASFAAGADQVARLPFTPDELAVRAGAVLRRRGTPLRFVRAHPVDGVKLDLDERAHVGARTITLGPALNSLLYLLVANSGRDVSRDDVRRLAWGTDPGASDRAVNDAVRALGRRLGGQIDKQMKISEAGVSFMPDV